MEDQSKRYLIPASLAAIFTCTILEICGLERDDRNIRRCLSFTYPSAIVSPEVVLKIRFLFFLQIVCVIVKAEVAKMPAGVQRYFSVDLETVHNFVPTVLEETFVFRYVA